jgi:hypothetical protein
MFPSVGKVCVFNYIKYLFKRLYSIGVAKYLARMKGRGWELKFLIAHRRFIFVGGRPRRSNICLLETGSAMEALNSELQNCFERQARTRHCRIFIGISTKKVKPRPSRTFVVARNAKAPSIARGFLDTKHRSPNIIYIGIKIQKLKGRLRSRP